MGPDPWPHYDYTTVSENGCNNCHLSHSAQEDSRLLHYSFEEDNCLVCHNGNVASKDIESELLKSSVHAVQDYVGIHDAAEDFVPPPVNQILPHVECVDCHNPHQANSNASAGSPLVSGTNKGVSGVNAAGMEAVPAQNQFEICFKCHASNNVITSYPVTRQIAQLNTLLEFNPANPSFHPVEAQGVNTNVPSLLAPYTINSVIFCTDCHNNDDPSGPTGPHGSNHEYLLNKNYETTDGTVESPFSYALCYKCHSRASIIDSSILGPYYKLHYKHIVEQNTPCAVCHDPHGISVTQGSSIKNSHLINFDLTIVKPDTIGERLYFEDLGNSQGQCYLKCHSKDNKMVEHAPEKYP
jgi:hypothetical protein